MSKMHKRLIICTVTLLISCSHKRDNIFSNKQLKSSKILPLTKNICSTVDTQLQNSKDIIKLVKNFKKYYKEHHQPPKHIKGETIFDDQYSIGISDALDFIHKNNLFYGCKTNANKIPQILGDRFIYDITEISINAIQCFANKPATYLDIINHLKRPPAIDQEVYQNLKMISDASSVKQLRNIYQYEFTKFESVERHLEAKILTLQFGGKRFSELSKERMENFHMPCSKEYIQYVKTPENIKNEFDKKLYAAVNDLKNGFNMDVLFSLKNFITDNKQNTFFLTSVGSKDIYKLYLKKICKVPDSCKEYSLQIKSGSLNTALDPEFLHFYSIISDSYLIKNNFKDFISLY